MFWGLILEPNRYYSQKVKVSFHVSMAALDVANSSDGSPAQVMCVFEGRNYLLCTLNKEDRVQCSLDLNFEAGTEVTFATNGKAFVHLTGYLINDEDVLLDEAEEEEEEEEVDDEDVPKDKKRLKKQLEGAPNKKTKALLETTLPDEDSSSDSDFDVNQLVEDEEDEDAVETEEEEDDDEVEDEEDESGVEEEEAEDSEEEEVPVKTKPKQNGVAKPSAPVNKKKEQKQVAKDKKNQEEAKKQQPRKIVLKGGVIVQDLKEGNGEVVKNGKFVHVYYEGRLKDNNKMFDSTTKGPGFSFRVGKGEVIKGWDIGLVGMKLGGQRRIVVPAQVGYGSKGSPPVIPPNATLVFDVTLKKIS